MFVKMSLAKNCVLLTIGLGAISLLAGCSHLQPQDEQSASKNSAIATLSVASGRELPDHKAEMGTQILMGHTARVLKSSRFWLLVQSSDGYLSWVENGAVVQCSVQTLTAWTNAPLLIVTAYE